MLQQEFLQLVRDCLALAREKAQAARENFRDWLAIAQASGEREDFDKARAALEFCEQQWLKQNREKGDKQNERAEEIEGEQLNPLTIGTWREQLGIALVQAGYLREAEREAERLGRWLEDKTFAESKCAWRNSPSPDNIYAALARAYACRDELEHAREIVGRAEECRTVVNWALIEGLLERRAFAAARKWAAELGVPGAQVEAAIATTLAGEGNVAKALKVINYRIKKTFAYARQEALYAVACALARQGKANLVRRFASRGEDVYYRAAVKLEVVKALAHAGRFPQAEREASKLENLPPNPWGYVFGRRHDYARQAWTAILYSMARRGWLEQAYRLLSVASLPEAYIALAEAWIAQGDLEQARGIVTAAAEANPEWGLRVLRANIVALFRMKFREQALGELAKLTETRDWFLVIRAIVRAGLLAEAKLVLERMSQAEKLSPAQLAGIAAAILTRE
jgi:tetratricopeptide (TPR) repeat protein